MLITRSGEVGKEFCWITLLNCWNLQKHSNDTSSLGQHRAIPGCQAGNRELFQQNSKGHWNESPKTFGEGGTCKYRLKQEHAWEAHKERWWGEMRENKATKPGEYFSFL